MFEPIQANIGDIPCPVTTMLYHMTSTIKTRLFFFLQHLCYDELNLIMIKMGSKVDLVIRLDKRMSCNIGVLPVTNGLM